MNGDKPDSFDDLDAVTMIRDARGGWNLFANGSAIPTMTWPSLFPDPMEAIINLASVLTANSQNPAAAEKQMADDYDAQRSLTAEHEPENEDQPSAPELTHQAPAPKSSRVKRARRPQPVKRPRRERQRN